MSEQVEEIRRVREAEAGQLEWSRMEDRVLSARQSYFAVLTEALEMGEQLSDASNPEAVGYLQPPSWAVDDAREKFEQLRGVEPTDDDWSVIHDLAWKIANLMDGAEALVE